MDMFVCIGNFTSGNVLVVNVLISLVASGPQV